MRTRAASVLAPAAVLFAAAVIAPHARLGEGARAMEAAGMVAFAGGVIVAVLATSLAAACPDAPLRRTWIVPALALVAVVVVAVAQSATHSSSAWLAVAYCSALVVACSSFGALVGARIQDGGHLLPACVVAACADVISVVSAEGPSHAIASSERLLSLFAVGFPLLGTRFVVPTLGVGDVTFVALVLAAVERHRLGFVRAIVLVTIGLFAAGAAAFFVRDAIPALPFVAVALVAGVPGARAVPKKDRAVATIAIGIALALVAWAWLRRAAAS